MDQFSFTKKQLLLIILLLFLMAAVPVTIYLTQHTQIFKPKADVGDSCSMNLNDGQQVSGFSFHVIANANRTNPSSYLAIWIIGAKGGGDFSEGGVQQNYLDQTLNSTALFDNGPGIIECRVQTDRNGGTTLASSRVTVNVYNDPATIIKPGTLPYTCNISGPSIVAPGQQVTVQYAPTNHSQTNVATYIWRNLISNPYDYITTTSSSYTFTAPSYTGYFPQSIILYAAPGAVCYKDFTVSNDPFGALTPGASWVMCSQEGSVSTINGQKLGTYCRFAGTGTVRYGRDPVWYTKENVPGEIPCNSGTFGYVGVDEATDPNAQKVKHCEYLYQGGPLPSASILPAASSSPSLPPIYMPSPSPIVGNGSCVTTQGDANGDGRATGVDFSMWTTEFLSGLVNKADFNCDGLVNGIDFSIWSNAYLSQN